MQNVELKYFHLPNNVISIFYMQYDEGRNDLIIESDITEEKILEFVKESRVRKSFKVENNVLVLQWDNFKRAIEEHKFLFVDFCKFKVALYPVLESNFETLVTFAPQCWK